MTDEDVIAKVAALLGKNYFSLSRRTSSGKMVYKVAVSDRATLLILLPRLLSPTWEPGDGSASKPVSNSSPRGKRGARNGSGEVEKKRKIVENSSTGGPFAGRPVDDLHRAISWHLP